MWCPWMNLNPKEYTHVPLWIRYPGILLGESYNGICALTDLFVIVKIPNSVSSHKASSGKRRTGQRSCMRGRSGGEA
jgi:hypothetical protein